MNIASAAIFMGMIVALGVTLWGLFARQKSVVIGVIATAVALLAAAGGWYSWAETKSMPWTAGYGILVAASLASAVRQFAGGGSVPK
jgi:hypothetical protein